MNPLPTPSDRPGSTLLQLLVRPSCLLCLEAEHVLALAGITEFERVDIERDPDLEARYGDSIPVVRLPGGEPLAWPFSAADIRDLLALSIPP